MKSQLYRVLFPGLLIVISAILSPGSFRAGMEQEVVPAFEMSSFMIPMRDGVKLNTNIFVPKNAGVSLPIILERSPYNAPENSLPWSEGKFKALAADGYIFVFQDIRGRYKSEGQFVMLRPPLSLVSR